MMGPLEKDNVYPVAAETRCHTAVKIINDIVPYLITDLTEYPLLQYATNRPQNTDQDTTVASKYHQYGFTNNSFHGSGFNIP